MSVSERSILEKIGSPFAWERLVIASWLAALATIVAVPYVTASPTLGDDLTRNTVRLSLAFYAVAVSLMLLSRNRLARSNAGRLARLCWTLAWAAYLVHLAMAFHHYHHWSHPDAVRHTREVSGIGEGIYVSHLFTVLWTIDVAFWWLRPERYAVRSAKLTAALHAFMAFVIFCGTVVYESGPIRWLGVALFAWLAFVWLLSRLRTGVTISEKRS
jgi:hypothetical protein